MSRFVDSDTATLTISGGDTLTIRRELNNREQREAFGRMYERDPITGALKVNPLLTGMALVTAYLLDWSLMDGAHKVEIAGRPVEELMAALDNLSPASFTEIKEAIERHEASVVAERQKKVTGATPVGATSPSAG